MYQRALDGYEKALGREHTSTLNTVNHLGLFYKVEDKLAEGFQDFYWLCRVDKTRYDLQLDQTKQLTQTIYDNENAIKELRATEGYNAHSGGAYQRIRSSEIQYDGT